MNLTFEMLMVPTWWVTDECGGNARRGDLSTVCGTVVVSPGVMEHREELLLLLGDCKVVKCFQEYVTLTWVLKKEFAKLRD